MQKHHYKCRGGNNNNENKKSKASITLWRNFPLSFKFVQRLLVNNCNFRKQGKWHKIVIIISKIASSQANILSSLYHNGSLPETHIFILAKLN